MATHLSIRNGVIHRHDRVDHADGDKMRRHNRDLTQLGKKKDGNDPMNEAFSFSTEEFFLLQKLNPALKDPDPHRRAKAWRDWSNTSVGRAFRVR